MSAVRTYTCTFLHIPRSCTGIWNFKELMEASKRDIPKLPTATGMTVCVAANVALLRNLSFTSIEQKRSGSHAQSLGRRNESNQEALGTTPYLLIRFTTHSTNVKITLSTIEVISGK